MASPTVNQLAALITALTIRVDSLEKSKPSNNPEEIIKEIYSLINGLKTRLDIIEGIATDNKEVISDLKISDEASGWKQWREEQANKKETRRGD